MKKLLLKNATKITYIISLKAFAHATMENSKPYTTEEYEHNLSLVDDKKYIYTLYGINKKPRHYSFVDTETTEKLNPQGMPVYGSFAEHCFEHFKTLNEKILAPDGTTYTIEHLKELYYENGDYVEVLEW